MIKAALSGAEPFLVRPRRSALYMPASNQRAMDKAQKLPADVIIFDLEDAVAPGQKAAARELLQRQLAVADYGDRELVVRVNGVDSEWFRADLEAAAELPIAAVALPKVEGREDVERALEILESSSPRAASLSIWPMIETPAGVWAVREIAASAACVDCLVMGTSDLAKELNLPSTADRAGLLYSLSHCVLAAREQGIDILDGVCLNLDDEALLLQQSEQGRALGFNGKTLIHPAQLEVSHHVYGVDAGTLQRAEAIVAAWREAEQAGSALVVLEGKLVESLHVEQAQALLQMAEAISVRGY